MCDKEDDIDTPEALPDQDSIMFLSYAGWVISVVGVLALAAIFV